MSQSIYCNHVGGHLMKFRCCTLLSPVRRQPLSGRLASQSPSDVETEDAGEMSLVAMHRGGSKRIVQESCVSAVYERVARWMRWLTHAVGAVFRFVLILNEANRERVRR